jgi:hypothetical protein
MLPDVEQLTKYLLHHRNLRDIGTVILLIGVIAEILIDNFWESSHPPLLRGRRATTLLKQRGDRLKKPILIFVGLILVGGGIALEWWQGTKADNTADRIRVIQQARIADAEDRATEAQHEVTQSNILIARLDSDAQEAQLEQEKLKRDNLNLAKALQPRHVGTVEWDGAILTGGLERFAGTPVLIQSVPDWESTRLAVEISGVLSRSQFGWKPSFVDVSTTTVPPLAIADGVQIFTVRDPFVLNPRPLHPGTKAQKRAALAAETLSKYLQIFNVENEHRGLTRPWEKNDAAPKPFAPEYSASDDTVIVLVGRNTDWQTEMLVLSNVDSSDEIKQLLELKDKGPPFFGWERQ